MRYSSLVMMPTIRSGIMVFIQYWTTVKRISAMAAAQRTIAALWPCDQLVRKGNNEEGLPRPSHALDQRHRGGRGAHLGLVDEINEDIARLFLRLGVGNHLLQVR